MEPKTEILLDWLKSKEPLTSDKFDEMKELTRGISPSEQILFLKKVINEIARGHVTFKVDDLVKIKTFSLETCQEFGEPKEIDYTLDLILHTLNLVNNLEKFPNNVKQVNSLVLSLADFVCDYLQNRVEYLRKLDLLFDPCPGRTAIVRKKPEDYYINLRGNNYKVYDIYKGYSIKNQDKSGRGELVLQYEKGIYAKGKVCMLEIIERKSHRNGEDYIRYGKNIIYKNKLFQFSWKKDGNKYLFTPEIAPAKFCEGRKSPKACELSGKEFWWCYVRHCFSPNQKEHSINDWHNYSLKDFLKILDIKFDEIGYYIFVSEINRLNRLIERIKCTECKSILRPSRQSEFAFYRVSQFHCNNPKCTNFHKEIYLTHCLNSKCTNIIDDRIAKRCSNGFIICDQCGSCCSNDQFARRIETLKTNGDPVPQKLIEMLSNNRGHWERAECYCYKCQKEMDENNSNFICKDCNISYDHYNIYIRFFKDFKALLEKKRQLKKMLQKNQEPPI